MLKAARCEVHRGYYADMRPVPGSAWIWFTGIAWKAVFFSSHSCTQYLPNWINTCLQQIVETMPALPWHSWASARGRGALQTFGSHFYRAATAKCAPWKTAEHTAELIWLALPFPNSTLNLSREQASSGKAQAEFGNGEMRISLWHLLCSVFDINWQLFIWSLIQASGAHERSVAVREMW